MTKLKFEVWRGIEGYLGYMVSNFGNVKSIPRKGRVIEKLLVPIKNYAGYLCINLYKNNLQAKLSVKDVNCIKDMLNKNISHRKIAKVFNVVHSTIGRIHRVETWKGVECSV